MESEARYTLVGAAVVALVVAVVAAVLWLKGPQSAGAIDRYSIYFQRQSLDGLQVGSDVTMLGISIGKVEGYAVDTRTMNRVRVTVRIDPKAPVTPETTAVIQRNLLTGIARIAFSPPATAGAVQPHTVVPPGEPHPVIAEGVSDIDQIADTATQIAQSGALALDNLNSVLSAENRAAITKTLASVRDITSGLDARMGRIDEVTTALAGTAAEARRASREIAEAVRDIRTRAAPAIAQADTTLRDVSKAFGQADTTLRDMSQAVGHFEREAAAVTQRMDATLAVGALEIGATTREIRATAEILARTIDRVPDPRTALFGPRAAQLGPGEQAQ